MNHANSFNQVILIGRMGKDPIIKKSRGTNPTSFVSFSIATYKKFKDKKITNWSQVHYWGDKQSAWAMEWLKKGMLVQINGELSTRKYKDQQGAERTVTDVRAYEIIMLANPRNLERTERREEEYPEPEPEATTQETTGTQEEDDSDFY